LSLLFNRIYFVNHCNIMTELLQSVYDSANFRKSAHSIVDVLADYLENIQGNEPQKVINWKNPSEQLDFWKEYTENEEPKTFAEFVKTLIENSTHLHHAGNLAHQVSPVAPIAAIADLVAALMNNSTAIYEIGGASSALEKIVTTILAKSIDYPNSSDGFLTSGGTLANVTALLAARANNTDVWENGYTQPLAVIFPEECHYSIERAARIIGIGTDGIIKVPTNEHFQMKTNLLEEYYQKALSAGKKVIAIAANAGSTSTGSFDDLNAVAAFAEKHNLWFHVDGAHGGATGFSKKYKHLLAGINRADSVTIDCHKMLMTPALTSALLFKSADTSYQTFVQKAVYLWSKASEQEWYNLGKRTFECTKLMMSIKVYSIIKMHGIQVFDDYITTLFDLGASFAQMIQQNNNFELATYPMANIVCFRYLEKGLAPDSLNALNNSIRDHMTRNGNFYLSQTQLHGKIYLRVALMNPLTTIKVLQNMLDEVFLTAQHFTKNDMSNKK